MNGEGGEEGKRAAQLNWLKSIIPPFPLGFCRSSRIMSVLPSKVIIDTSSLFLAGSTNLLSQCGQNSSVSSHSLQRITIYKIRSSLIKSCKILLAKGVMGTDSPCGRPSCTSCRRTPSRTPSSIRDPFFRRGIRRSRTTACSRARESRPGRSKCVCTCSRVVACSSLLRRRDVEVADLSINLSAERKRREKRRHKQFLAPSRTIPRKRQKGKCHLCWLLTYELVSTANVTLLARSLASCLSMPWWFGGEHWPCCCWPVCGKEEEVPFARASVRGPCCRARCSCPGASPPAAP